MASVLDPVRRHAAATPDNIALRGGADQWTYRQLRDASVRYAGALTAAGVSPGDRVLLAAPSVPEFVVAYLGNQDIKGAEAWRDIRGAGQGVGAVGAVLPAAAVVERLAGEYAGAKSRLQRW
ncbi:AMP-binding protein [Streptomyces sp. HC307]|uniref:AMP-binding protein n=1 Tax=Streptomyces flavusporus TaxID=3385496 RepID=UPI003917568B